MKNEQTKPTVFQRLQQVLGGGTQSTINRVVGGPRYNIQTHDPHKVIATASSEAERNQLLSQHRQQALLAKQWKKTQYDLTNKQLIGLNELRFMYVDCDLMDNMPEIGAALDITAEEVCSVGEDGQMVKVTSNSERVKGVLEDLFTNRLAVNTTLPMVARSTCKYGNTYMQLNLSATQGVLGWTQLPVKEIERYDNGMKCPYDAQPLSSNLATVDEKRPDDTKFIWIGSNNEYIPFRNWQIAHFRLLYDSQYLPYGVSFLNKARRHFRMLSMMEDMMLIYRLDRSMERRIFNIDVGNIDEQDVPAYIDEIANNFKRTPIIDPTTGQVDLRKNIMGQMDDFFIPRRPGDTSTKIETLSAGQNLTAMDDVKYMQNKVVTALRVPKAFLNFEDNKGDGKNLSMLDVRFSRTINRIQQTLLLELNKIAIIHLYLLGFTDELTQFKLSMRNPSSQAEMLELENLAKKVTTAKDAVSDPGTGIPLVSMTWALKHIMKFSNKEIQQVLEELRLESALAAELQKTTQIIKRTGLFDPVDNIYGESGAEYTEDNPEGDDGEGGPMGGGGGGGLAMGGGDFDFGEGGEGEEMGAEGEMPMDDAAAAGAPEPADDNGPAPAIGEAIIRIANKKATDKIKKVNKQSLVQERKQRETEITSLIEQLSKRYPDQDGSEALFGSVKSAITENKDKVEPFFINEEMNHLIDNVKKFSQDSNE